MDDTTLGGYQEVHGRPPAFGAADGQAYSVDTFADDLAEPGRYGAALLFVRWGEGERPVGHLETDYLAFGATRGPAHDSHERRRVGAHRRRLPRSHRRRRDHGDAPGQAEVSGLGPRR